MMGKKRKKQNIIEDVYEECNDVFAYIAGHTEGGFPYGVSWEEAGIDPDLPFDEKVKLYYDMSNDQNDIGIDEDDLPF